MNKAEAMINSKRNRRRSKDIQLINEQSGVTVQFEIKINFIENMIERDFRYFEYGDEVNNIMTLIKSLNKRKGKV